MNPSETAFLALGLVLGAAIGAAIVEAVRARPASRREVRVTVVPNSVSPRRSTTLADAGSPHGREPIPGSPDDTAWPEPVEVPGPPAAAEPADEVAEAVPVASEGAGETAQADGIEPGAVRHRVPADAVSVPETAVAVPIAAAVPASVLAAGAATATIDGAEAGAGTDLGTDTAPAGRELAPATVAGALATAGLAVRARPPVEGVRPGIPATAVAVAIESERQPDDTAHAQAPEPAEAGGADSAPELLEPPAPPATLQEPTVAPAQEPTSALPPEPPESPVPLEPPAPPAASSVAEPSPVAGADPCAGARTLVDERCALAAIAREQAKVAADALREAQRAYDMLRDRVERAQALADPREIAAAKDALHRAFRQASAAAASADDTEAAARDWLNQVNDLNARAREAARQVEAGGAELRAALPRLERLSVEADAARIGAESAELTCHEARDRLAQCEEALAAAASAAAAQAQAAEQPVLVESGWPTGPGMQPGLPEPGPEPGLGAGLPRIIRILRGDAGARDRVAEAMAGGDAEAARTWHIRLARLLDAISARAIEDGYLDLPDDHPFWGLFTHHERREIVGALSALGFRYDGLGAFTDGRVPAQRDLSLAVGYAGLDRMRIRAWPREGELVSLYEQATVAADEWLAHEAGDLSMGEMVDALGARAADLTDAWNAWGRLRPALLAED